MSVSESWVVSRRKDTGGHSVGDGTVDELQPNSKIVNSSLKKGG